jgi:hypothetical protein
MSKREVWIALAGMVVGIVLAVGYARYFNWWDVDNCSDSGGVWNEAQGRCIEPSATPTPR